MMKNKSIFITGGAGYVGAALVPNLLKQGYKITVLDLMIYGENNLPKHKNLTCIKGDIRNISLIEQNISNHDTFIHLACISNDPSFELNPLLGKSINLDAFKPLVETCIKHGVDRFIYASSSSVYGIKKEVNVHEDMTIEPLTDYSRFKADCEKILLNYNHNNFTPVIIRPATVCGYSPRQRLDVVVNILTNLAYHKNEINVIGGTQLRPNIHINDMIEAYNLLIQAPKETIKGKIYNAGYENQSVMEIAMIVKSVVGDHINLKITPTNDNRSYHISSKKINEELGFITNYTIRDAVNDLCEAFKNKKLKDTLNNEFYFNIKRMQNMELV